METDRDKFWKLVIFIRDNDISMDIVKDVAHMHDMFTGYKTPPTYLQMLEKVKLISERYNEKYKEYNMIKG